MKEVWKDILGWEGKYEVSSHGKVRSHRTGRCLKPSLVNGYHFVYLQTTKPPAKKRGAQIHRLMLETFTGYVPKDRGIQSAHRNGKRTDNRIENLRWATKIENEADKKIHGTHMQGERHHKCKITEKQAIEIKSRLASGERPMLIAKDFPFVTPTAIYDIKNGHSWTYLDKTYSSGESGK